MIREGRPIWLDPVLASVERAQSKDPVPDITSVLRPAAVLVLLIDDPEGPLLLLTERAAKLRNYPSNLVFPGGAVEPGDNGPVATALREANEEVGIDPDAVNVIGVLSPLALPATGFVVTAVVGWCSRLELTRAVNPDEVAAIVQVPLDEFAGTSIRVQRVGAEDGVRSPMSIDSTAVGAMTAAVIDVLFMP